MVEIYTFYKLLLFKNIFIKYISFAVYNFKINEIKNYFYNFKINEIKNYFYNKFE